MFKLLSRSFKNIRSLSSYNEPNIYIKDIDNYIIDAWKKKNYYSASYFLKKVIIMKEYRGDKDVDEYIDDLESVQKEERCPY